MWQFKAFHNASRVIAIYLLEIIMVGMLPLLLCARLVCLTWSRRQRISIWTGAPIITVAKNCKAEKLIGFRSLSIVRTSYYITDEFDYVLSRLARNNRLLALLLSYPFFLAVCVVAQQVHAYSDGGLLPSHSRRHFSRVELFIYRFLKIRLFIWTYGADVRTRDITRSLGEPNCCTGCTQVGIACICNETEAATNAARISKAATAIFSMGDMIEYTQASRNDLFFWPIDLAMSGGSRYEPAYPVYDESRSLRVVHAPNHRELKGTAHIERAVAQLRHEGFAIELVLVEKLSNEQALQIYRSADIIFDQCLIGFHGYFALEAMALGKPVVCFIRKPEQYLLSPNECPILNTHVLTITKDLRDLIKRRSEFEDIGKRSRQYIEKYYSLEAFAARLDKAYADLGIQHN